MPKFLRDFFDKKGKKGVQNLVLMLLVGVLLLVTSTYFANLGGDGNGELGTPSAENAGEVNIYHMQHPTATAGLAAELEEILSLVAGAGEVRVMVAKGAEAGTRVFAQNSQENTSATTEEDGEGGIRNVESVNSSITYVMMRQSDGGDVPLLLTETIPVIEGIIIVAQGGGDAVVREALTRAVQALLGVAPHRIQVFEME